MYERTKEMFRKRCNFLPQSQTRYAKLFLASTAVELDLEGRPDYTPLPSSLEEEATVFSKTTSTCLAGTTCSRPFQTL
jgi:hypothetical protein